MEIVEEPLSSGRELQQNELAWDDQGKEKLGALENVANEYNHTSSRDLKVYLKDESVSPASSTPRC
jgi:hypothetical protein